MGKNILVTLIPAMFMSTVTCVYILMAKEGLNLPVYMAYAGGALFTLILLSLFLIWRGKLKKGLVQPKE